MKKRQLQKSESRDFKFIREKEENISFEDYSKMKVGLKTLDDAIMNIGSFSKSGKSYGNKDYVLQAIEKQDPKTLREISDYYFNSSGIYARACELMAYLYKYDWYVTCSSFDNNKNQKNMLKDFYNILTYLDNSDIKILFGRISLEVIKHGSYYGCVIFLDDKFTIQQLPSSYCRSRFYHGTDPVIELNLKFFDDYFTNVQYRLKVLSMFPKEIQKAYVQYKEGKLTGDYPGDDKGWAMIDPELGIKFSLNNSDLPALINAIPSILDLDSAQELDRKKMMQQLLKIIIQKLPLDKNGDLIFDPDEARDLHNNAVAMLKRAIGVDVLTTFAEVEVANMKDNYTSTSADDLKKSERTVYNNLGISQNLFNTEGNLALEKSIANDEASIRELIYQYERLLRKVVRRFNKKNKYNFNAHILHTTIYNYKDLSKMYKEHTQIGYSKMLPQIALGHSQKSIIEAAFFENEVLHLSDIMIPPMSSNTMSNKNRDNNSSNNNTGGRPEKTDEEKSEKTIQNQESMS